MQEGYERIVVLGNSQKFIVALGDLYPNAEITVFPWRGCYNQRLTFAADLFVICGYDYASSTYGFRRYIAANVAAPLAFLRKNMQSTGAQILYINTDGPGTGLTYSRYAYAKNLLAEQLSYKYNKHTHPLRIPTVVDDSGLPQVRSGPVSRSILLTLARLGLLKTVGLSELSGLISGALSSKEVVTPFHLGGRFLGIKRNLFVDRLLRLLGG